ncbi:MAG: hypothetical protein Kow0037_26670 [Calditrichia bacterium]
MPLPDVVKLLPKIKTGKTTTKTELVEHIKERTGLVKSDVVGMLAELEDTLLHFLSMGRPVKLEGIGTFSPSIKLDGTIKINFRIDKSLGQRINLDGAFTGEIVNKDNIGKSITELENMASGN